MMQLHLYHFSHRYFTCNMFLLINRSCEKEVMSLQFFCLENRVNDWVNYWKRQRLVWWRKFANIRSNYSLSEDQSNLEPGVNSRTFIQVRLENLISDVKVLHSCLHVILNYVISSIWAALLYYIDLKTLWEVKIIFVNVIQHLQHCSMSAIHDPMLITNSCQGNQWPDVLNLSELL